MAACGVHIPGAVCSPLLPVEFSIKPLSRRCARLDLCSLLFLSIACWSAALPGGSCHFSTAWMWHALLIDVLHGVPHQQELETGCACKHSPGVALLCSDWLFEYRCACTHTNHTSHGHLVGALGTIYLSEHGACVLYRSHNGGSKSGVCSDLHTLWTLLWSAHVVVCTRSPRRSRTVCQDAGGEHSLTQFLTNPCATPFP